MKKSMFRKSTEILIVIGLILSAFLNPSTRQFALYVAAGIWVIVNLVYYGWNWTKEILEKSDDNKQIIQKKDKKDKFITPDHYEDDPLRKLLRHVNHRITDKVKSCFPDASWDWDVKPNVNFLMHGGTGRIRLMNAKTYNFAEVCIDRKSGV